VDDGRYRAIKVMRTGVLRDIKRHDRGDSRGSHGGSGNNGQSSQPLPFMYQPLQQLPPQLHMYHKSRTISPGNCSHPFPQLFPSGYMPHSMFHAQSLFVCQQFPMGLQHPHMFLQQHYGVSPQLKKMVNSVGYSGPPIIRDAREYQHVTACSAPGSYNETSRSPRKSAT